MKSFKKFVENEGSDKGMMGFGQSSSIRKPSSGQPFKNLSSVAGQTPRGSGGGSAAESNAQFMKKMNKN